MSAVLISSRDTLQRESTEKIVTAQLIRTVMSGLAKSAGVGIPSAFPIAMLPEVSNWHGVIPIAPSLWFVGIAILMLFGVRAGRAANRQALDTEGLLRLETSLVVRASMASIIWGS